MTTPDAPHFALVGLVVGSRTLPDRPSFQRRLLATLKALNRGLGDAFQAPLELTAGDEARALLARPEVAVTVMITVADALEPVRMAWGLGRGPLSTDPGPDVSVLDGPCLHRARDAAAEARKEGDWLRVEGVPSPHGQALSSLVSLMGAIRRDWTDRRAEYVREARTMKQKEVAEAFDVAESTVSQALKAAHFRPVLEAESAAAALLEWLGSADLDEDAS